MLKHVVLATLLVTSNIAFACGGKPCAECDGAHDDQAKVEDITKAPGTHVALDVTGMTCGACSAKVTAAVKGIEGVNAVSVDHETGKAEVAFDESKTNSNAIIAAITKLSFAATVAPAKPVAPAKQG